MSVTLWNAITCNCGAGQFRLLKCDHILANHPGFPGILARIRVFSRATGKYLPVPGISRALPDQYIGGRSGSNPRHNTWIHSYLTSSLATHTCIACVPSNTRARKTHSLIPMYTCTYECNIILGKCQRKQYLRNSGQMWWVRDIIKETSKKTGYYMGRRKGGQGFQVDTFSSDMAKSAGGIHVGEQS